MTAQRNHHAAHSHSRGTTRAQIVVYHQDEMTSLPSTTLIEAEGRELAVCEYGDPTGRPLFQLHGSPGSRYQRFFDEAAYTRAGFRAIMFDRPGFGRSPRRRGRTLLDGAADIVAVANALGIDRFAVLGISAGGPHALAVAALHPQRVMKCAAVVSRAPRAANIDWLAGMADDDRATAVAALEGEGPYTERLEAVSKRWLANLAEGKTPYPVPPAIAAVAMQWMPEAWAQGVHGGVDDGLAALRPWGYDLASIRVPTSIWSGDEDGTSPYAHGEWLAQNIPGATLVKVSGGHTSFFARFDEILQSLRTD